MRPLHTSRTIASSERGAALVMTLLVLVILTAFGLTLVALGTSEVAMSSNWRDYSKDFYAAEAALESGVVGLRNLLPATPTPTQAQLNTIATPPTLSDARLTFGAYTITAASPAPNRQTFATGPYSGLFGWVQGYAIQAQVNGQGGTKAKLTQVLQHTRVPLFQFGIFYGKGVDLELRPGPPMTFNGKIFANSNIYIAAGGTLQITDSMKAAGNIYRSIKSDTLPTSNPQIADAAGTLQTLNFDHTYQPGLTSTWSPSAWASQAMQTFGGQVQDSAMGVQQIVPPLPDLFGNPSNPDVVAHQLIEMPQVGDSPALASAKMYSQAGLRIVNDGTATQATDQNGSLVTLPPGAVTPRTFYDARESKTMTAYDVDVNVLRTNSALPANGVLYVAGTASGLNPVVRLVNGSQLPSGGLTVVSQNPVYIAGDYNTVPVGANHPPAAVLGDAVTVLSNSWQPGNAGGYDSKGNLAFTTRVASDTTVNAAIATGPSSESTIGRDNGKVNNLVRFLENWSTKTFTYSGSLLALWHSQQVTGAWRCCGTSSLYYYAAPSRFWSYDTLFDTTQPPGTPMGVIMTKGSWSQS